jgi:hypothetical protein
MGETPNLAYKKAAPGSIRLRARLAGLRSD